MQGSRVVVLALSVAFLVGSPALGQRRAPPSKGEGSKRGRDQVEPEGKGRQEGGRRRAPPSADEGWKVRKPAEIANFAPLSGPPGSRVVIRGQHLGADVRVRFNGRDLRVLAAGPSALTVSIPPSGVSDHFVLSKPGFPDVTADRRFEVVRPPAILRFSPPRGDAGISVTIEGTNFLSTDVVVLGSHALSTRYESPRRLTAIVTRGATTARLGIQRDGRIVTLARGVFAVAIPPPVIAGFRPTSGPPGTVVRIDGSNFEITDVIELAGQRLPTRQRGPRFIEVVVRGASGPFVIRGQGGRRAASSTSFTVVRPPQVRSFSPSYGPPGTRITLQGAGFLTGDEVLLGAAVLTVRTVSDQQVVAELPAGVRSGRIAVRRGSAVYAARGQFEVIDVPRVNALQPTAGPVGTMVTIRGENFLPGVSALLSGKPLPIIRRQLPTEIVVRIPPTGNTGRIVVVTRGGSAQSPTAFTVNRFAELLSFFPLRGVPGTRVRLTGRNFHHEMGVFLGTQPLGVADRSPTSATVVIPGNATGGRFFIESYGRRVTSRMPFVVEQPKPELAFTFSPPVARRGGDVTLRLTPPRPDVTVLLDGRPLPKKVLSGGNLIVITVPADTGRVGWFEVEYRGRRYKAAQPLRVR